MRGSPCTPRGQQAPHLPTASALRARFCSLLLPGDFHYKYPLIGRERGRGREEGAAHTKRKAVITGLGLPSRDSQGFDMAVFHTYGPSGGQLPFRFHYRQAGLPGELLPRNEFPKKRGQLHFFYSGLGSNFAASPPKPPWSRRCATGEHNRPELWQQPGKPSPVWSPPASAKPGGAESTL